MIEAYSSSVLFSTHAGNLFKHFLETLRAVETQCSSYRGIGLAVRNNHLFSDDDAPELNEPVEIFACELSQHIVEIGFRHTGPCCIRRYMGQSSAPNATCKMLVVHSTADRLYLFRIYIVSGDELPVVITAAIVEQHLYLIYYQAGTIFIDTPFEFMLYVGKTLL